MDTVLKVKGKGSSKACEGPCGIFEHESLLKDIQNKTKQLSLACLNGGTAGSEEEMGIAEHDAGHQDWVCMCVCFPQTHALAGYLAGRVCAYAFGIASTLAVLSHNVSS